ncbi:FCD domain-containing protein [Thermovenabulum gondwanense]|uniref:HTH-type transcriptional repressor RspR n=1 Tax=Thermovenabulum gondwanense TaxID=520767 RepID=A0A161PT69_9FIRM|nr:FCD domain-containing protein [Thermovenabulum gondwanense]KYO64545.1 HTH-type transcriptional repressor RspR [Thermovenabulum gondwanense]
MVHRKEEVIFSILKMIAENPGPVGSGYVRENLRLKGIDLSEATCGRILRQLDTEGYTEKIGFKGRILTSFGLQKLKELESEQKINAYSNELKKVIKATGRQELLDILVARKAIESQMAKLAAKNVTSKELKEMKEVLEVQKKHVEEGISIAEEDVKFHKLIAQAARNRVLDAALDLIRQYGQLSPILEYIRLQVKGKMLSDHNKIYEAIEKRDEKAAEAAMIEHIENLMKDVEKYWDELYSGQEVKR